MPPIQKNIGFEHYGVDYRVDNLELENTTVLFELELHSKYHCFTPKYLHTHTRQGSALYGLLFGGIFKIDSLQD